jgi:Uma2 family endonuclease
MAIMDLPRVRHTAPVPPPEPHRDPRPAPSVVVPDPELWRLFEELDVRGFRKEFLEGRIVVTGTAAFWHSRVIIWLGDQLRDVCEQRDWERSVDSGLLVPATGDYIRPDLTIVSEPDVLSQEEGEIPLDHVQLVVEVISPGSKRADREIKLASFAKAAIPYYLLIDRFTDPMTVNLHSDPGADGYRTTTRVLFGDKLHIPEPFDVTLDTAALPLP